MIRVDDTALLTCGRNSRDLGPIDQLLAVITVVGNSQLPAKAIIHAQPRVELKSPGLLPERSRNSEVDTRKRPLTDTPSDFLVVPRSRLFSVDLDTGL